jgi:hypothetical protein
MRSDILDLIETTPPQHSNAWFRMRLGNITGSQVGRLMKPARKEGELSADAQAYIKEIVAERLLSDAVKEIDMFLEKYIDITSPTSRAMAWGNEYEHEAIQLYEQLTGNKVTRCGSIQNETEAHFWDSPDGIVLESNGTIEVKCPMPKTHAEYLLNVRDGESLKKLKPEYYWQCYAHMANLGAMWCDWMSYQPFLRPSLHVVRIARDEDEMARLEDAVKAADNMADVLVECARSNAKATLRELKRTSGTCS